MSTTPCAVHSVPINNARLSTHTVGHSHIQVLSSSVQPVPMTKCFGGNEDSYQVD